MVVAKRPTVPTTSEMPGYPAFSFAGDRSSTWTLRAHNCVVSAGLDLCTCFLTAALAAAWLHRRLAARGGRRPVASRNSAGYLAELMNSGRRSPEGAEVPRHRQ